MIEFACMLRLLLISLGLNVGISVGKSVFVGVGRDVGSTDPSVGFLQRLRIEVR